MYPFNLKAWQRICPLGHALERKDLQRQTGIPAGIDVFFCSLGGVYGAIYGASLRWRDIQLSALQLPRRIVELSVALRTPNLIHKVLRYEDCDEPLLWYGLIIYRLNRCQKEDWYPFGYAAVGRIQTHFSWAGDDEASTKDPVKSPKTTGPP
jgi:hypothetical protein